MKSSNQKNGRAKPEAGNSCGPNQGEAGRRRRLSPASVFTLQCSVAMAAYYALVRLPLCDRLLYADLCLNARLTSWLLNLFGERTAVIGSTVRSAHYAITVRRGCDAIEPAWFLASAVLCFPGPWRRKLAAVVLGVAALQLLNVIRLVSLYWCGRFAPSWFKRMHLEVWPAVFIVVVVVCWLAWIRTNRPPQLGLSHEG